MSLPLRTASELNLQSEQTPRLLEPQKLLTPGLKMFLLALFPSSYQCPLHATRAADHLPMLAMCPGELEATRFKVHGHS